MKSNRHRPTTVMALLAMFMIIDLTPGKALATQPQFTDRVQAGDHTLVKKGTGVLRYMVFIEAYAGVLYTLPDLKPQDVLTDTPKRLEVEYNYAIKGEDFGPATYKGMQKFLSDEEIEQLRERIDYHNSLYVDVQPGDRYALTYVPGVGTELSLNGKPMGTIEGADFAAALFALWLGEKPLDKRFRAELLGLNG